MTTVGWLLLLFAGLLINGVVKGRSISEIPGDLGDVFTAAVTGDNAALKEVFSRKGGTNTFARLAEPKSVGPNDNTIPDMPTTGSSKADLIKLGNRLKEMGYNVSEHPSFGGVKAGAHVKGSQHYIGEAIDINADSGFRGGEKAALDNANNMAKAAGFTTLWQVKDHFDHLHVAVKK